MEDLNIISLPENILDNIKNEAEYIKSNLMYNYDIETHTIGANLSSSYNILLSQLKELKISFKKYYNIDLGE